MMPLYMLYVGFRYESGILFWTCTCYTGGGSLSYLNHLLILTLWYIHVSKDGCWLYICVRVYMWCIELTVSAWNEIILEKGAFVNSF